MMWLEPCCGYLWGSVGAKSTGVSVEGALEELVMFELNLEGIKGVNSGRKNRKTLPQSEDNGQAEARHSGSREGWGDQGQRVQGLMCHVKDLSLENESHRKGFQQRNYAIKHAT